MLSLIASCGTEKCGGCGLLVTFGDAYHLDGLKLFGLVEHHLVIVWWLQSSDCEGSSAHPIGDHEGNSSGIKRLVAVPC